MQQYCLRWNNHQPNFISVFSSLLNSESLVDVTLAAEGRHLQAHKVVLSACSSYFQSLFTINPCQHPIVILKDVKFVDLKVMVDFMYYGEVNVSQDQLPHILKTAEMLKIKGLAEIPMDQSIARPEAAASDRAELLTTGDTNWSNENVPNQPLSPSPCPSSPSCRRKRLRKSSTGSGSGSLEKSTDESHLNDCTQTTFKVETVIKSDSTSNTDNSNGQKKQNSSDSDAQRSSSQESTDGLKPHIHLQIPQQDYAAQHPLSETSIEVQRPSTSTVHQPECGLTWESLVEQATYDNQVQYNYPTTNAPPTGNASVSQCILNMTKSLSPSPSSNNETHEQHTQADTPLKKKRSVNPQSEENFIKALDAVRFGGIGFCKAARMYGVNNRTLWLEYKKRGYPNFRLSIKNRKTESTPESKVNGENVGDDVLRRQTQSKRTSEEERIPHHEYEELPSTSTSLSSGTVSFFDDKHIEFGQMIQRMNSTAMLGHQQNVHSYQTVNFEHIN